MILKFVRKEIGREIIIEAKKKKKNQLHLQKIDTQKSYIEFKF